MNYIAYTARFLYRIKWWLILCPLLVALLVYIKMGTKPRNYKSTTTIYTGIVSGYDITTTEGSRQDWNVINNAMDNLINIILSQSTLKNVSLRLYAQGLTHLDPDNDNQYLSARTSRYLLSKTPPDVMELVDHTSEKNTYENLRKYEEIDHNNHVYGMFHWSPPYYSYQALSQIKVKRLANSDMLEISYENDDPAIVYNTLIILNDEFVKQYRDLRFGETNNVIAYFESELERVGNNLRNLEDSLRDYNVQHRVINYDEQTKHIAALSRDYELRYEEILLNFESAEKLRASIEGQLEGLQETFRNNAEFIEKLHKIGSIYSRLSAAEAFQPETDGTEGISDRTAMPASRNDTGQLRRKLSEETRSLQELTTNIANQQYTKEGLSANTIVTEWLRRTAGREIPRRTGGDEAPQTGTRPEIYAVLARGLDPETQGARNQLLGTVLPLDPHGAQHGPPAAEEPADDLGNAEDHQRPGASPGGGTEQTQDDGRRGRPRHAPVRTGILHPARTARPHAA